MFDLAASGGPGNLGYLGYCPCNWMGPVGLWSVFLSAAERSILQDYIPWLQRKERDGKHGDKEGSERTSTETLPCSQHGHHTSGCYHTPGCHHTSGCHHTAGCHLSTTGTLQVAFPTRSSQALPSRTAPPFHLPISDPSRVPPPRGAPWGAGHPPQSPGRQQAAPTTGAPFHGLPRMGWAPGSGGFQGERALHKAFQTARTGPKAPILFLCKTKPTKLHGICIFGVAQLRGSPAAPLQCTLTTLIVSPLMSHQQNQTILPMVATELSPVLCPQPLTHCSVVLGPGWLFSLGVCVLRALPHTQCHSSLHCCLAVPGTDVVLEYFGCSSVAF